MSDNQVEQQAKSNQLLPFPESRTYVDLIKSYETYNSLDPKDIQGRSESRSWVVKLKESILNKKIFSIKLDQLTISSPYLFAMKLF